VKVWPLEPSPKKLIFTPGLVSIPPWPSTKTLPAAEFFGDVVVGTGST